MFITALVYGYGGLASVQGASLELESNSEWSSLEPRANSEWSFGLRGSLIQTEDESLVVPTSGREGSVVPFSD